MIAVQVKEFSMGMRVNFAMPVALIDAKLGEFSQRLHDPERGFALTQEQVHLRHTDILYGYEFTASFYGGNATLTRTADGIRINLRGGKTRDDFGVIVNALERFTSVVDAYPDHQSDLTISAVGAFENEGTAQEFFQRF